MSPEGADSPPEVADRAARERAVMHPGSVLVQAPAGSGKTTLLTQRYLRLLATVDAPERILALTFTRRAAAEMRARVAAALAAAAAVQCPDGLDPETWRLAAQAARHLGAAGVDLARHPARLRIETIDAFNAWLTGQLPLVAGNGAALATRADAAPLYRLAAGRALGYEEPDAFGAAVERVLALGDQRWRELADLIGEMLASRERWLPLLAGGLELTAAASPAHLEAVRAQFDADLALLVERTLAAAAAALGAERLEALARILTAVASRPADAPAVLAPWRGSAAPLRARAVDVARWRGLAASVLTKGGTIRARVTKAEGFPQKCPEKPAMEDLLREFERDPRVRLALGAAAALPDPAYADAQWERVQDVARVLLLAAAELERVQRELGACDFAAVSMAARRALGEPQAPTDLALRLDYRLQHILVDEFQDTSAAQLELLRLLTAGWQPDDGRSVFCVGDPMQSIYGFREAQVGAFLRLAEDGIGTIRFDVQRLQSNFRAADLLVDWVNQIFAQLLPPADDRERGAVAYRPSRAARTGAGDAPAAVQLTGYAARGEEAAAVAAAIAATAAERPRWRIAVLVRARAHAQGIAAELRRLGCAYRAVDLEPLQDLPAVRDLLALTRALLHLGDRTAWFAVLRAPWCGLELADLLCIGRAGPIVWEALQSAAVRDALSDSGRQRCQRLCATLERAFALRQHGSLARWIERAWLALGGPCCAAGERDLDDAQAFFARLRGLEQTGLPDAADFDSAFADLYARDAAGGTVEIMTIHKAKGLEFDCVFLPGLDRTPRRGDADSLLLSRQFALPHRDAMVMAARPPIGADEDRLYAYLRVLAREESQLEAERLLYVACTRAKRQLHLSATVPGGEKQPKSGSLLELLWPMLSSAFLPAEAADVADVADTAGAAGAAEAPQPGAGPLRRLPLHWSAPPPAVPFPLAEMPVSAEPRIELPVFDWAGETARQVGILVHAELQRLSPADAVEVRIRERQPHYRRWLALRGVPPQRLGEAAGRVVAALLGVCRDPRGRWILGAHRDAARELALSGPWNGAITRVVFDRSFVDAAGIRWIIDYKTSEHRGGGLEEFLEREVERYRSQMQRYAAFARRLGTEPVRVGLYFPLMSAWREWAPAGDR